MNEDKNNDQYKLYFFYFLVGSIIVLLVFSFIIVGSFWSYWSKIWRIEEFYGSQKNQASATVPTINRLDPLKGDVNAKVTIIEYSDFFCPACNTLNNNMAEIENLYGNNVKIVFKCLPIINQLEGKNAAMAAYCAAEQNKFWEYKDLLFQNSNILYDQTYKDLAKALNLNEQNFNTCLASQRYESLINNNLAEALKLEITSLPTVYVNNQKMDTYITLDGLKTIIEKDLNSI
jgi:protein-disulfide isomerase